MNSLASILHQAGQPTKVFTTLDGSSILVLPHGGRVLGLFARESTENFYWTHPALNSVDSARAFYANDEWPNSGGDRTWIAPEVDVFLPDFPKVNRYHQPRALDPGEYCIVADDSGFTLENCFSLRLSRLKENIALKISKSFGPAPNPLRYERGLDLRNVQYAGYTQRVALEFTGVNPTTEARIGLWNLIQMPHGGDLLLPTFSRVTPHHIFSTIGSIPTRDLVVSDHLVRFRMNQKGDHKISLRAAPMTGRGGYFHRSGSQWSLIIRNFSVNPSGEYVDVPWDEPDWLGFAVQACNVNSDLGMFSELEYHAPAISSRTGCRRCHDEAQIWAFRGTKAEIQTVANTLLTPMPWIESQ